MTAVVTLKVLLRSSREDPPVWDTSTLAVMFSGPYSNDHEKLTGSSSANHFQRMARQTEVSLEKDVDRSWRSLDKRTISEKESKTS